MSRSTLALAPLFRTEQQRRLLSALFTQVGDDLSVGELATEADVPEATASREIERLAASGLLLTRPIGRNTMVSVNWSIPWSRDLRAILMKTVGVPGRLSDALSDVPGIEEVFIYGSWAARFFGEGGPQTHDVDVLIIGAVPLRDAKRVLSEARDHLRVDVNPVVIDRNRWTSARPDAFVEKTRTNPLIPVVLEPKPVAVEKMRVHKPAPRWHAAASTADLAGLP